MPAAAVAHEFSIAPCGPFDRLLARAGLKGDDPSRLLLRAELATGQWPLAASVGMDIVVGVVLLEASGNVQGLSDRDGSFERVYAMRLLPITL